MHDDHPIGHTINTLPRYVPSTTLKDPAWANTHVIGGDVEGAVRELKARPGNELQVHGSGVLLRWLLERDLVDELNLTVFPVVVGDGLRLFPEHGPTHDMALVSSRSTPSGVTLLTYRRVTAGSRPRLVTCGWGERKVRRGAPGRLTGLAVTLNEPRRETVGAAGTCLTLR